MPICLKIFTLIGIEQLQFPLNFNLALSFGFKPISMKSQIIIGGVKKLLFFFLIHEKKD
jgi:hypothetical protein